MIIAILLIVVGFENIYNQCARWYQASVGSETTLIALYIIIFSVVVMESPLPV
ncbi:hypothetical protein ACFPFV_12530 [Salinicoccus siamensis]|uniref:hypothetical protein n=1 Tax=Salinicoccus siamensis TaxID=381830 RepID=UPI003606BEF4